MDLDTKTYIAPKECVDVTDRFLCYGVHGLSDNIQYSIRSKSGTLPKELKSLIPMKRILLAVPSYQPTVLIQCIQSLYNIEIPPNTQLDIEYITGYGAAQARNKAVNKAIDGKYDYILFCDADQIIPTDALHKLMWYDVDFAAGWSMMCVGDNRSNISKFDDKRLFYDFYLENEVPKETFAADAVGFAIVLMKTSLFTKLDYPYFKYIEYGNKTILSEDLFFCDVLRCKGIPMVIDTSVKCGHVKSITI